MDSVLQEEDIIVLSDNKSYSVVKIFEYENESYIYLIRRTEFDEENPVIAFAKERIEGESLFIDVVDDYELLEQLATKIKEICK